jgi:hypothetical protein
MLELSSSFNPQSEESECTNESMHDALDDALKIQSMPAPCEYHATETVSMKTYYYNQRTCAQVCQSRQWGKRVPGGVQVWNGHIRESEHVLLDPAVAIQSFCVHQQSEARLAVAAAQHVYIYIGVKVHFKITLPLESVQAQDEAAWCVHATPMCHARVLPVRVNVWPRALAWPPLLH